MRTRFPRSCQCRFGGDGCCEPRRLAALLSPPPWSSPPSGRRRHVAAEGRYANPQLLVETEELARMLGAPGVRIVDVRGGMTGVVGYRVGHVPGAAYLDEGDLDDPTANAEGLPIRPAAAAALFGGLGIDHETTVVAYDDAGGAAGRSTVLRPGVLRSRSRPGPERRSGEVAAGRAPARGRRADDRVPPLRPTPAARPGGNGGGRPGEPRASRRLPDRRPQPGRVHAARPRRRYAVVTFRARPTWTGPPR